MISVRYILGLALLATFLVGCGPIAAPGTPVSTADPTTAPSLPETSPSASAPSVPPVTAEPGVGSAPEEQTPQPKRNPAEALKPTALKTLPTNPKDKPVFGTLAPAPVLPAHTPGTKVDVIQQATEDLARRLEIEPDQIQLTGVSPDEFPASDLGCPAPGQTPLPNQGMVTGRSIVLEAGGQRYLYRAHGGLVVYCGER